MKITVDISYKDSRGEYGVIRKCFKSAEALSRWIKDQSCRGNKITGMLDAVLKLDTWDWDVFFEHHPDHIAPGTWDNALIKAKEILNLESFVDLIERKQFLQAKKYMEELRYSHAAWEKGIKRFGRDPDNLGGTGHGDDSYSDTDPGL